MKCVYTFLTWYFTSSCVYKNVRPHHSLPFSIQHRSAARVVVIFFKCMSFWFRNAQTAIWRTEEFVTVGLSYDGLGPLLTGDTVAVALCVHQGMEFIKLESSSEQTKLALLGALTQNELAHQSERIWSNLCIPVCFCLTPFRHLQDAATPYRSAMQNRKASIVGQCVCVHIHMHAGAHPCTHSCCM